MLNPRRPHVLNSMVLSVEMSANPVFTSDGEVDKKAPNCKPDPAALLETPIRLKFFHLNHDTHPHQRKLLFHENDTVQRVRLVLSFNFCIKRERNTNTLYMVERKMKEIIRKTRNKKKEAEAALW